MMQAFRYIFVIFTALSVCFGSVVAQKRLTTKEYCDKYGEEARRQMKKHGVPASITLAQGILESGWGASYLATKANNHFGIKAYRGWNGPVVRVDDDKKNEPFCKFRSVEEGYEYHSTFLKNNQRYDFLFKLDPIDYEGWAHGLKKAGYATNPKYAHMLIKLIEENHLDVYDVSPGKKGKIASTRHEVYITKKHRGLRYVRANAQDDLAYISKEFNISKRKLRKWNDLLKNSELKEGDIIYLQAKHSKADKAHPQHVVKAGESMQKIAQMYGVTVKSIMKRNNLSSAAVRQGQVLKLR